MATDTLPNESATVTEDDLAAWDNALAKFRLEEANSEALWAEHSKAEEAWEAACPRVARYFDEFKLGIGMNRENVEYWLHSYVTRTGNKIDVAATAGEFMAYQKRNRDSKRAHRVEECFQRATNRDSGYFPARDALMAIPAPDNAALLVKIEIATMSLDDDHSEAMLADARRLLGQEG